MDTNRRSIILETLQKVWYENPVAVITAGALAVGSLAKLIDAVSAAKGRRAYAKQVNYRVRHRK
jgi:hypothetical protein